MNKEDRSLTDALHVFVLWSFAVAQPLLEVISRNVEFFVAHGSKQVDIIMFLTILCFLIPGMFVMLEATAGLSGTTARKTVHYVIIAGLSSLTVLFILKRQLYESSGTYLITVSAISGVIVILLYARSSSLRNFLTVLSPIILIFPALALFNSPVSKIILPNEHPSAVKVKADNAVPIVMIIFDEFNVTTLMNKDRKVDRIRYPHFAAFSEEAIWFRNATTVSESTDKAVPAILTGQYPDPSLIPIASDHPQNLFTLLGSSYDLNVVESVTQLCPPSLCSAIEESLVKRMSSMISDLSLVYMHIIFPEDISVHLPAVTRNWKDFQESTYAEDQKRKTAEWRWSEYAKYTLVEKDRAGEFRDFINSIVDTGKPSLFFLHTMLPHAPYKYLPSGKTYNATGFRGIVAREKWSSDEQAIIPDYQHYILQVGFVDTLLGELLTHLKTIGLYDRALIVITADHGVSFLPGDFRRPLTETNFQDIMPMPLFMKLPNKKKGRINDLNVETIDILPTIADILEVNIPWQTDGQSALDLSLRTRSEKVIYFNNARKKLIVDSAALEAKYRTLERMLSLFGSGSTPDSLYKAGPYSDFVGRQISRIATIDESSQTIELNMADFYEDLNIDAEFIPVEITGHMFDMKKAAFPYHVAIAVNGTIHAVAETFHHTGEMGEFAAIVPEDALRNGRNEIEVFVISGSEQHPRMARTKNRSALTYFLSGTGAEETITTSEGESLPIVPHALEGHIDFIKIEADTLHVSGWAADIKHSALPDAILVFKNDDLFFKGFTGLHRPGVVNVFGSQAPAYSGYEIILPMMENEETTAPNIRVFAISKGGKASELFPPEPPVMYTLSEDDGGGEVIISSDGRSLSVAAEALKGYLEDMVVDSNGVLVTGWAVDAERGEPPERILIFANGVFYYAAPCNTDRDDVVERYENINLRRSGFAYRFYVSISEDDIWEARFFAISKRGFASELTYPKGYKWGRKPF